MATCPDCTQEVAEDARFCGACGCDIHSAPPSSAPASRSGRPSSRGGRRRPTIRRAPLGAGADANGEAEAEVRREEGSFDQQPEPSRAWPQLDDVEERPLGAHPLVALESASGADLPHDALPAGVARHRRQGAQVSSESRTLQLVMLAAGVVLLGLFFAPWSLAAEGAFLWQMLGKLPGLVFASRLLLIGGGVLFIAAALLPLPPWLRAVVASAVGGLELALRLPAEGLDSGILAALLVMLPGALLLRHEARGSWLARVVAALGALGVLAWLLIPRAAGLPLLILLSAPPTQSLPLVFVRLLPLALAVLALLSFLVFLPRSSGAGAWLWAALLLFWSPAYRMLSALAVLGGGGTSLAGVHGGVVALMCGAAAAVGLAHLAPRPGGDRG